MQQIILKRLYEIKECPGIYLGQKSLTYLYFYITGYQCRQREIENNNEALLSGFQDFIQKKYKLKSCHNWANIITFFELNDEAAFNRFYVLLEEFLKTQPKKLS